MLKSGKECLGFRVIAEDGEIGRVDDFLFLDDDKQIHYLVVNTGLPVLGRKVLLSPAAVRDFNGVTGEIRVNLTKDQVEKSPDIDMEMPVSREHEMQLLRYYNWPEYWSGNTTWHDKERATLHPIEPESETDEPAPFLLSPEGGELNPHLRSLKEVRGYHIDARGEIFGHIEDAIFRLDIYPRPSWPLRYLIVDTKNWWPSLPVAISTEWILGISWEQSLIHVDLDRETIKTAPELKTGIPIDRDYEERLHRHYGKHGYWEKRVA